MTKKQWQIFDRAYDKAAKLKPGEKSNLYPLEEEILRKVLHRDWLLRMKRKDSGSN